MASHSIKRKPKRNSRHSSSLSKYLSPREQRLVRRVRARVHKILSNGEIQSLVLYGSRVYGKPRSHSDIDLFLVYDHATPAQEAFLADVTDDLPVDPPLHVFLYRAREVAEHNGVSPLIYNVAHRGVTLEGVPVPKLEIDRTQVSRDLMEKAKEKLQAARLLIDANLFGDSISRSYYAILHAADAALATKGFVAKSHEGTESLFGFHFMRSGLVDAKFKGLIKQTHKLRNQADYQHQVRFTRDDAERWFQRAQEFVAAIDDIVRAG